MAALFTILLGASGVLLGYFLHDFGERNFLRETEAAIDSEMKRVLSQVADESRLRIVYVVSELAANQDSTVYYYQSAQGELLAGNISDVPGDIQRIKEGVIGFDVRLAGETRTIAAKIHTFEDSSRLLIGRDIHGIVQSYEQLKLFTGLIMAFMFIVIMVSFLISTFVVRRINLIAETAKDIMDTGDLTQRISIEGDWDDLSNLAQVLNQLLLQIESLMQGVRDVSNNIAHDLRTPLTRIRNRLEAASKEPIGTQDAQELLEEADKLLGVFSALLRISRIEKSSAIAAFAHVHMQEIICDVVELYDPVAEEKGVTLRQVIHDDVTIAGEKDLLFQLLANVCDNAIKYTDMGGMVEVSLKRRGDMAAICVSDSGAGISDEEKARVYERFYRSDKSRGTQGSGLGLSLVKAIVDRHGGSITLADNHPGLRVFLEFHLTN